jgi:NADH-quinone oxidoreductase subunit F
MLKKTTYLSHSYDKPDGHTLAAYEAAGGYKSARKALGMSRDAVVEEVK